MSEQSNTPRVDVPTTTDIRLTGDTQSLADSMTDAEMKGLIIQQYRMIQEMLGFVRDLQKMMDAMSKHPMAGMMGLPGATGGKVLPFPGLKGKRG